MNQLCVIWGYFEELSSTAVHAENNSPPAYAVRSSSVTGPSGGGADGHLPPVRTATPMSIRTGCQTIYSSTNHRCRPRGSGAVAAGEKDTAALSQGVLLPGTQ